MNNIEIDKQYQTLLKDILENNNTNIKYLVDNHILDEEIYKRYSLIAGISTQVQSLTKEEFFERIKTDDEFAKKWGVGVICTELTTKERMDYWFENNKPNRDVCDAVDELQPTKKDEYFNNANVPKQLIKLTYNNNTIQVYE
jgi:hypothetical protein